MASADCLRRCEISRCLVSGGQTVIRRKCRQSQPWEVRHFMRWRKTYRLDLWQLSKDAGGPPNNASLIGVLQGGRMRRAPLAVLLHAERLLRRCRQTSQQLQGIEQQSRLRQADCAVRRRGQRRRLCRRRSMKLVLKHGPKALDMPRTWSMVVFMLAG